MHRPHVAPTRWAALALLALPWSARPATTAIVREPRTAPPVTATLVAHYVADPAGPRRISNLVELWNDQSGAGNHVWQLFGELFPHFEWFGLNGRYALRFDGTDRLVGGGMPTGSYSVLAMIELDTLAGDQPLLGGFMGGVRLGFFGGSGRLELSHHGVTIAISNTVMSVGVPTIVRVTYDAPTGIGSLALDGVVVGSGMGPVNSDSTLQFGAAGLAGGFKGAIAEAAIFSGVLTPVDLAFFEGYLAWQYQASAAPDVRMQLVPRDGELLARKLPANNAVLAVSGAVHTTGYTNARLAVLQNNVVFANLTAPLVYVSGVAAFAFSTPLPAGLFEYDLIVSIDSGGAPTYVHIAENVAVGDVILINGQSNASAMDYYAENLGNAFQSEWIRSFGSSTSAPIGGTSPDVRSDFNWDLAEGENPPSHATVGSWALKMGSLLVQSQGVPIALINGAEPGTAISQHLRNPAQPADPTTIYGRLLLRTSTAGIASKARAMIWHQGESDFAQPGSYASRLAQLHLAWFLDYPALERVIVVQCRLGCGLTSGVIPEVHRTAGDTLPKTSVMSSTALPGYDGCHYFVAGYHQLAPRLAALLDRDLHGGPIVPNVDAPNVASVRWSSPSHTSIVVKYRNPADTLVLAPGAEQFFVLDDPNVTIQSASVSVNSVTLQLSGASTATILDYNGANGIGIQPWLTNLNGVGALTFFHLPIL